MYCMEPFFHCFRLSNSKQCKFIDITVNFNLVLGFHPTEEIIL